MTEGTRIQLRHTKTIHGQDDLQRYDGPVHDHWKQAALSKGFVIVDRVIDKDHVLLECSICGQRHAKRHSVVLGARTLLCPHCLEAKLSDTAAKAGLEFLRRSDDNRHYGLFRAPCGHDIRRQFELIARAARRETGIRCETCHAKREAEEARERGWELVGSDPKGNPNFRIYCHTDGCGAARRLARVNMQTGRFDCEVCGDSWTAAPSFIYLMRFDHPEDGTFFKLGYSRDPESRLKYQLGLPTHVKGAILRTVSSETGHAALCTEKKIHQIVGARLPEAVVAPERFADWLNVVSEIYAPEAERLLQRLLDAAAAGTLGEGL